MGNETRAVVIGASVSGLLAAAALSDSFDQVTVVERDQLPSEPGHRRAVPRSRHLHGLMARGLTAINSLLPGFENDLAAAGAVRSDLRSDIHWYLDGHLVKPEPSGITGYSMTRRLLEHVIRTRVRALPGVTVTDHCDALDLIAADGAVTGVRVISRADGAEAVNLAADLVVDAAGRTSRTPQWLNSLGYTAPTETTVPIGITYVSREYRRQPHHLHGRAGTFATSFPSSPRGAFLVAVEQDTFLLTTTGIYGEQPPMDDEGLLVFAESLPSDDVAKFLNDAVRTSEPTRPRFPAGLRRYYESLEAFPSGYLVIGDALCSFNPVYGQGMSVAAAEAELLRDVVRTAPDDLAAEYFHGAAKIVDTAWTVAVSRDQQFPESGVTPSEQAAEFSAYLRRVHRAATVDATVGTAFLKVLNLLAGPESLLSPALVERVTTASMAADFATTGGSAMTSSADGPLVQGEHIFTVGGVRLGYEVRGRGPVLMVHAGGPGIDAGYLRMPEIEDQLTMVYLDPVGTGRSDLLPGGRYTVAAYAGFVERTIQYLGLTRPYFLGHSHGGFVGLELAIRTPGLLGRLILYSSAPVHNAELVEEANRQMKLFADRWPDRPEAQHAAAVWAANRTGTVKPPKNQEEFLAFFEAVLPAYFKDYRDTVAARGPLRLDGVHDPARTGSPWDVRSELATVDLPTLVISGRYDFICSPRWGDELAAGISGARHLKLDDVGHFAHLERQREEFFSTVATFAGRAPAHQRD